MPDPQLSPAPWSEVVAIAADHGLTPLLYARVKENDAQADVPADVWERLRRAYFAGAVRSMSLYGELRKVLLRLRSAGIKVIVLKGAYLAEVVYRDAALRPMTDVDLMVPRTDVPRARAALLNAGGVHQRSGGSESRPDRGREVRLSPGVGVDIHWTIALPTGSFREDVAGLWSRAQLATIAGVEVLALSPEDLLLHLCLHAAYDHGFGDGLRPLCDVAETVRRFGGELDWAKVADRAREWRAPRYVGLPLHLARSMLGAGVPDDVLERVVPGGPDQRTLAMAREAVLTRVPHLCCLASSDLDLLGAKSLGGKAKVFWKRIFLSRDEMAAMYPASRDLRHLHFYYARRLRDVMRAHGPAVLQMIRNREDRQSMSKRLAVADWLRSGKA